MLERWWWKIVSGIALGVGLSLVTCLLLPPTYESHALIEQVGRPFEFQDEVARMRSFPILRQVISGQNEPDPEQAVSKLAKNVTVENVPNSDLIRLSVSDKNNRNALDIANTLLQIYSLTHKQIASENAEEAKKEMWLKIRNQEDVVEAARQLAESLDRSTILLDGRGYPRSPSQPLPNYLPPVPAGAYKKANQAYSAQNKILSQLEEQAKQFAEKQSREEPLFVVHDAPILDLTPSYDFPLRVAMGGLIGLLLCPMLSLIPAGWRRAKIEHFLE